MGLEKSLKEWEKQTSIENISDEQLFSIFRALAKMANWTTEHMKENNVSMRDLFEELDLKEEDKKTILRFARKLHLYIFHETTDEYEVYEKLGLSDEDNIILGGFMGGKLIIETP